MHLLYKLGLIVWLALVSYPLNAAEKIDPPFLFIGQERLFGKQIWQTDNTESGTHIYAYAQQHPNADANPYPMGTLENIVIFSAFSGNGTYLWRTDGTPEGTFSLKNMLIGHNKDFSVDERDFQQITAKLGSKLFFWSIGAHSIDLSVTDGSQSGTQVLKSFPLKTSLNIFSRFYSLPTQVHFAVENGAQGVEWWRSDGSVAGTQRVMDAQQLQGAGSHDFDNHNYEAEVLVGERAIYFRRPKQRKAKSFEQEDAGVLWKVTEQGAEKLHEFSPEEWPYKLLGVYDDQLFWQLQYNQNYGMNSELWRLKLSTRQTEKLHEFNDKAEALDEIGALHVFNNHLYLSLYTAGENQLWASDLATKDTQLLTTLSDSRDYSYGSPVWFEFAGRLYFLNLRDQTSESLWITDGTSKGTRQLLSASNEQCDRQFDHHWSNDPQFYNLVGDRVVFVTFAPEKEECLVQLWSLSSTDPEKPELLGEFAKPILLTPQPNTLVPSLQFSSNQSRWQTDGTKSGTKNLGLEPLSDNAQTEQWRNANWYKSYSAPILALTNKQGGWIMPYYDPVTSGSELWWVSPDPSASHLLKDINTAPASADELTGLRSVGDDWYYGLNQQLWFIKRTGNTLTKPQLVEGLPNTKIYDYCGAKQDDKALYFSSCTSVEDKDALWQVVQGKATHIAKDSPLAEIQQHAYVWKNTSSPDWREAALKTVLADNKAADIESIYEIKQGLLYSVKVDESYYGPRKIWWQPKDNAERQLIHDGSKENILLMNILETEHDLYAMRMDENIDLYDVVRIDLKRKRFVPIKGFVLTASTYNHLYNAVAIPQGICMYGRDSEQIKDRLWFIPEKKTSANIIKQAKDNESLAGELHTWGDNCYFTVVSSSKGLSEAELWLTQGTPETTRLIKKGVGFLRW